MVKQNQLDNNVASLGKENCLTTLLGKDADIAFFNFFFPFYFRFFVTKTFSAIIFSSSAAARESITNSVPSAVRHRHN